MKIKINFLTVFVLLFLITFSFSVKALEKDKKKGSKNNKTISKNEILKESDYFTRAVIEYQLGNPVKAMELLDKALEIIPDDPAALYEKSRLLSITGHDEEAYELALEATKIDPSNRWYKMNYANLARKTEKYKEYVKAYEELVEEYPENLDFLTELAYAYFYIGDYKKAVEQYHKIEEQIGINEALTSQIANLYTRLNEYDKAVAEYEKLVKTDPENTHYYAVLAEYCSKNKRYEKALWAYKQIEKINPNDPYVHISLADFYRKQGDTLKSFEELKLGMANRNLDIDTKIQLLINYYPGILSEQQQKQALELTAILIKTHPDDPSAKTLYASLLYQNEHYEKAKEVITEILQKDSLNYPLWEQLLFCNYNLKQYDNLVKVAQNVMDLFPNQPLPYLLTGMSYYMLKDYNKAIDVLNTGKDFVVGNKKLLGEFYSYLGEIYDKTGNYEACYDAYDKALKIDPNNSLVLNNYAYYLSLRKERLDKAEEMAKKAVALDPDNYNNLDTYSWVLFQKGKYEEALRMQKKALDQGGYDSGVVLEHYGDILFKMGEKEKALQYWKMATTHDDHSKVLDKKIKDVKYYEEK
jgi:tetratricopeptide (TPR) repeat protein